MCNPREGILRCVDACLLLSFAVFIVMAPTSMIGKIEDDRWMATTCTVLNNRLKLYEYPDGLEYLVLWNVSYWSPLEGMDMIGHIAERVDTKEEGIRREMDYPIRSNHTCYANRNSISLQWKVNSYWKVLGIISLVSLSLLLIFLPVMRLCLLRMGTKGRAYTVIE